MSISKKTRTQVLERDGFRCKFCGATAEQSQIQVDHITPKSKGGTDSLNNLATLCLDCNQEKSDQYFGDYMNLVQSKQIPIPSIRSPLRPPTEYQITALTQLIEHLNRSGIKQISLLDFSRVVPQDGLRDGVNPLFEPLSFATIADGLKALIDNSSIRLNGDQMYLDTKIMDNNCDSVVWLGWL